MTVNSIRDVGENFVLGRTNLKLVQRPVSPTKYFNNLTRNKSKNDANRKLWERKSERPLPYVPEFNLLKDETALFVVQQ